MAVRETPWAGADVSGESHRTIYNWVHTGHDLPGLSDVHLRYSAQGTEIQEAAGALGAALQGLAPFWHGRDAQAASDSVTRFVSAMRALGGAVTEQAHTMGKVHAATVQVQQEITEPVESSALDGLGGGGPGQPGGVPGMATKAITGGVEDLHAQQQAAAAAQEKARAAYRAFLAQTGEAAGSAPPLPSLPQAAVGATVAATVVGHIAGTGSGLARAGGEHFAGAVGRSAGAGAGRGHRETGGALAAGSASGWEAGDTAAAADEPGSEHEPGSNLGLAAAAGGIGAGIGFGAGALARGATSRGTRQATERRPAPGPRSGVSATPGLGGGPSGGAGSGVAGSAAGFSGTGGSAAAGGGAGGVGASGAGAGGAGYSGASAGAAGPAGSAGAAPGVVPPAAGAAGGAQGDVEHRRPQYLVEEPGLFGNETPVAPAVIGADVDEFDDETGER